MAMLLLNERSADQLVRQRKQLNDLYAATKSIAVDHNMLEAFKKILSWIADSISAIDAEIKARAA